MSEHDLPDGSVLGDYQTPLTGLTGFERRRLEKQKHLFEAEWETKTDRLAHLRRALAIETKADVVFQLEQQIRTAEEEIGRLEAQVFEIERSLGLSVAACTSQLGSQAEKWEADIKRFEQQPVEKAVQPDSKGTVGKSDVVGTYAEPISQAPPIRLRAFEFDVINVDAKGNERSCSRQVAEFFTEDLGNGVMLDMIKIPSGTFQMGSPPGQGNESETPQHAVTVPAFLLAKYPITQIQWRAVASLPQLEIALNVDPSFYKGDTKPVEQVSWIEAREFCQRLSLLTGRSYRLPNEAEWEYACRSGTTTPFYFGKTLNPKLARVKANLLTIFTGETAPVGIYKPNLFGLYDMHGNVSEWCADEWHEYYVGAPIDGSAWVDGGNPDKRVLRGGFWNYTPGYCRSASRDYGDINGHELNFGFRVACSIFSDLL